MTTHILRILLLLIFFDIFIFAAFDAWCNAAVLRHCWVLAPDTHPTVKRDHSESGQGCNRGETVNSEWSVLQRFPE